MCNSKNISDFETMIKLSSIQQKMTPNFIDYCNVNDVNLRDWYRWQLHLIWQQRKDRRDFEKKYVQPNK